MPDNIPVRHSGGAPLRPKPIDFRDQFIRLGWDTVDHYSTNWKVIARWVAEEGREGLQADRKAYRQMQSLQQRFASVADGRSSIVVRDFIERMQAYADQAASAAIRRNNVLGV